MGFTPRARQQAEIKRILGENKPKKKRGGTVSRKRGGGYIKPKENIIDDNASIRSRLRSEKRRKKAIKKAASKKRGGKIMYGYKAGGKV